MGETLMESKLNGIVGWKDFDDQIVKQVISSRVKLTVKKGDIGNPCLALLKKDSSL